jgi:hypothetical protein
MSPCRFTLTIKLCLKMLNILKYLNNFKILQNFVTLFVAEVSSAILYSCHLSDRTDMRTGCSVARGNLAHTSFLPT